MPLLPPTTTLLRLLSLGLSGLLKMPLKQLVHSWQISSQIIDPVDYRYAFWSIWLRSGPPIWWPSAIRWPCGPTLMLYLLIVVIWFSLIYLSLGAPLFLFGWLTFSSSSNCSFILFNFISFIYRAQSSSSGLSFCGAECEVETGLTSCLIWFSDVFL